MATVKRSGLLPGTIPGEPLIFDITRNQWVPASLLKAPTGAQQIFDARSLAALADGAAVVTWPDISGNALDMPDPGAAARPTFNASYTGDGIPAVAFDGATDFMRRTGIARVATKELTTFLVAETGGNAAAPRSPWALGQNGLLSNAAGNARGELGATTFGNSVQAAGAGGATTRNAAFLGAEAVMLDAGGWGLRRVYANRWNLKTLTGGGVFFVHTSYRGLDATADFLAATAAVAVFSYTCCSIGADGGDPGIAPINLWDGRLSYFAHYPASLTDRVIQQEMIRLRTIFGCV